LKQDLFKGLKHSIKNDQYLEFLTLNKLLQDGLFPIIDKKSINFGESKKPDETLMNKIKFEQLSLDLKTKIFKDVKRFYLNSMK
jgi:hypothetical protein